MKRKIIFAAIVFMIVMTVLFVPYRVDTLNDGGTKVYQALTYRVIAWNRWTGDEVFQKTQFLFGEDISKSISELWAQEEPNVEHRFVAKVSEYMVDSFLAEPIVGEWEASVRPFISVYFRGSELEKIGADVGGYVEVAYRGNLPEKDGLYPVSVKLVEDLRQIEYTGTWMDQKTAEKLLAIPWTVTITEIYANCFFAEASEISPFEIKINGILSDDWCIGDQAEVSFFNLFRDADGRVAGDMKSITQIQQNQLGGPVCDKPVIYLYPEEEMEVSVRLTLDGNLTCTYPAYGDGWTVIAQPDGMLTDAKGQTYSYLYWEGQTNTRFDLSEGFCVRGADTAAFLEDALEKLGLNRRETNEFIVYWLPLMEQNPYNVISFQTDCYTDSAQLEINPAPDTLIRVFMAWKAVEEYVQLPAQELTAPQRQGFTAVEWGGTEIT